MKKVVLVSLLTLSVFSSPHVHAMESTQQKTLAHGGSFFKALFAGLHSYYSKASNKQEISVALDMIKLIMDCNNSDFYAYVRTQLYDSKGLSELIRSIQNAVDLCEKHNQKSKPGNIIRGIDEAQKFIAFFNTQKDVLIAHILKNNYIEKANAPLKIINAGLCKQYIYDYAQTDFKHILKVLYIGLQEAVIYACSVTDNAHYGKMRNQLGHLAAINQYLDDIAALSTKFSGPIKKAIIDQMSGKIHQVISRAEYVAAHSVSVSESSEDEEKATPAKRFYRWDLKGLAFELEMLVKIVALEKVLGKLTHYNYTIKDERNNYREVTEFDFITEKAVIEVKGAFLDKNNQTQMAKTKNQLCNQLNAIQAYNLPKRYIFIGTTQSLMKTYFNHVFKDIAESRKKLGIMAGIFMHNADVMCLKGALENLQEDGYGYYSFPPLLVDTHADRYRNISERANYLRKRVGIPLEEDESCSDESIESTEDKDTSALGVEHISSENKVLYKPETLGNLAFNSLPVPIRDFIATVKKAVALNPHSYFFQMESKL